MVAQLEFQGVRVEIILIEKIGLLKLVYVMLQKGQRYNQGNQVLAVIFNYSQ